jgi:predicted ATPase/DNA-binding winged helix-turn-helix (wHTH) protein
MTTTVSFPPFRLDLDEQRIWKKNQELQLRRKPFAILNHLVHNPRRLVTREELVEAVWGSVAMSESLLRTHVRDLRRVLGDGFVETVHGLGYRFTPEPHAEETRDPAEQGRSENRLPGSLAGRDLEVDTLATAWRLARGHHRAAVFVHGEAGIGKTALLDFFLQEASSQGPFVVGRGACVERYGSGQAYLALLDAIGAMCRGRSRQRVVDVLIRHAPAWLAQLPGLLDSRRLEEVQRRAAGATQGSMLRELAEALEALSVYTPIVIVIEDLQWADPATAEAIAILCSRRDPARLLILGTYRPGEVSREHPLKKVLGELLAHRRASSIALHGLDAPTVGVHVRTRFPQNNFPPELISVLCRVTGGNPLFLSILLDDLVARALICQRDGAWVLSTVVSEVATCCPDGIARLIDCQIDRLATAERNVLEVAGIAGTSFTAGAVAHALDVEDEVVEQSCDSLSGELGLLRSLGTETWRDGTTQSRYEFRHTLLQQRAVAHSFPVRIRAVRRRIAERLEAGCVAPEGARRVG